MNLSLQPVRCLTNYGKNPSRKPQLVFVLVIFVHSLAGLNRDPPGLELPNRIALRILFFPLRQEISGCFIFAVGIVSFLFAGSSFFIRGGGARFWPTSPRFLSKEGLALSASLLAIKSDLVAPIFEQKLRQEPSQGRFSSSRLQRKVTWCPPSLWY